MNLESFNKELASHLIDFESYFLELDKVNNEVSNWSVGEQIDHSLKVVEFNLKRILDRNAEVLSDPKKVSKLGAVVLMTKFIPRNKGKAPERVLPEVDISSEFLEAKISKIRKMSEELLGVSNKNLNECYFEHFVFGGLSENQWLKFCLIHNHHHLKIIRDILS